MSRKINLDEKLAAKSEINKEPVEILFRDETWIFSPSLPAQLPELLSDGKIIPGLVLALNPDQREAFSNLGVTMDEVGALIEVLAECYGTTAGESQASE
jgi:hypothetical protein